MENVVLPKSNGQCCLCLSTGHPLLEKIPEIIQVQDQQHPPAGEGKKKPFLRFAGIVSSGIQGHDLQAVWISKQQV